MMIVMEVTQRWFFFFFLLLFQHCCYHRRRHHYYYYFFSSSSSSSCPFYYCCCFHFSYHHTTTTTTSLAPTLFNSFYFPSCSLPSVFLSYYLFHTSTLPSRFPLTCLSQFLSFFISSLPFPFFYITYIHSLSSLSFDTIYFSFSIISWISFSLPLFHFTNITLISYTFSFLFTTPSLQVKLKKIFFFTFY